MPKVKTVFFCKECGNESPKWLGKCPFCNSWNSFVEERINTQENSSDKLLQNISSKPEKLNDIVVKNEMRINTRF